jgi:hypothetical protein
MSTAKKNDPADDSIRYITTIDYIAARWCLLPPHIRETIVTLVDTTLPDHGTSFSDVKDESSRDGKEQSNGH